MTKSKKQPPSVVLEYQYPADSSLRVRVVKQTDDYGEVRFEYEQSTEADAMGAPRWISAEAAVKRNEDNFETIARRVVDLLGQVLGGKVFP